VLCHLIVNVLTRHFWNWYKYLHLDNCDPPGLRSPWHSCIPEHPMRRPFTQTLLALATCASLFCMLLTSVCLTCEPVVHADDHLSDAARTEDLFANDWQSESAGCTCCDSDGCSDSDTLPDGLLQRRVPITPVAVALPLLATEFPRRVTGAVGPARDAAPPGHTKLHIQHGSFLC